MVLYEYYYYHYYATVVCAVYDRVCAAVKITTSRKKTHTTYTDPDIMTSIVRFSSCHIIRIQIRVP